MLTWSNVLIQYSSHYCHHTACEDLRRCHSILYSVMVLVDKIPVVPGMVMVMAFFLNELRSLSHRKYIFFKQIPQAIYLQTLVVVL